MTALEFIHNKFVFRKADEETLLLEIDEIEELLKEYAEIYAAKVLKLAADKAETKVIYPPHGKCYERVNEESILNIKLPQHT